MNRLLVGGSVSKWSVVGGQWSMGRWLVDLIKPISNHLSQFLIVLNIFSNPPSNKSNIYERDWSNFDQENFILDYFSIDWNETLKIEEQNIIYSTEIFLNKINKLLDNFAPFKKISKYKLKFKSKPWITPGLQKSISVKNKFLSDFIKKRILLLKQNFI